MTRRETGAKIDYDTIARRYDTFRKGGGPYLPLLVALAQAHAAQRVLEVGAGTGNNTVLFQKAYPEASLITCDLSWGMIERAREKQTPGAWVQADAHFLPFAAESVDFCFGCFMLHYISDLRAFFRGCARVLRRGCAAFVTASHEFIERHPMNCYFPSFAAVDKARFPSLETVRDALHDAGFRNVSDRHIQTTPQPIDEAYLRRVENQFISTYALLPEDEFKTGLARLREDIKSKGRLETGLVWESVTIWGEKDTP
ncbi:MAG TPA: class I SAM-dependent methyltransferase [Candidatus Hydrogenedentes bacterium]|nr:class I SAM-dependent methyltransferase [Candidatus Hydrogenedentota bacterium]